MHRQWRVCTVGNVFEIGNKLLIVVIKVLNYYFHLTIN